MRLALAILFTLIASAAHAQGVYFICYTTAPHSRDSRCEHIEADSIEEATEAADQKCGSGTVLEVSEALGVIVNQ